MSQTQREGLQTQVERLDSGPATGSSCKTFETAQDDDDKSDERKDTGDGEASSGGGAGSAGIGPVGSLLVRALEEVRPYAPPRAIHWRPQQNTRCARL